MQLSFRDETQGVIKKAQLRSDTSKAGHLQQCKPTGPVEGQVLPQGLTASNTLPAFLSIDAVDQAVTFFFRSHVNEASESCSLVYKDLPGLYAAEYNSALSCVIKAIGLAGLSSYRSAPALMPSAFAQYSLALGFVGSALRNPALAKTDQTLLTIYLLGIYEVQPSTFLQAFQKFNSTKTDIGREEQSMKAWEQHIAGAAALLKLRGKQQFQTERGVRLFVSLRNQLVCGEADARWTLHSS